MNNNKVYAYYLVKEWSTNNYKIVRADNYSKECSTSTYTTITGANNYDWLNRLKYELEHPNVNQIINRLNEFNESESESDESNESDDSDDSVECVETDSKDDYDYKSKFVRFDGGRIPFTASQHKHYYISPSRILEWHTDGNVRDYSIIVVTCPNGTHEIMVNESPEEIKRKVDEWFSHHWDD